MRRLIQTNVQPKSLQTLSSAILNTKMRGVYRLRYRTIESKMSVYLNNTYDEDGRRMFNHFCERLLPITFHDWMTKR